MNVIAISRTRLCSLALLPVLASWAVPGHAVVPPETGYAVAPVPAWVVPVEPAGASARADVVGGQRFLLVDRQYRGDGETVAYHHHGVTDVVGQAGLSDNSKLSVSFDPGYQRLELHAAAVLRDGRESERLERARVSVVRTESESDRDLLNGEVTALVVLPDIRVGDRVEIRYTLYGRNPVFGDRHHSSWRVRWGVPVERSVLRVSVPRATTLTHTPRPEAEFSEESGGALRTLQWRWDGLESSEFEEGTPDRFVDPDRLEVTAYRNWREVADWGAVLFANPSAGGAAYRELSRSIRRAADEQGLQPAIAMAIDHVQRRIRYYGVELGENSHRPHAPDEVLRNGYGDCKDKALLLTSLLDDLGVDAWPILVSSQVKRGIVDRLPSPGVFDHVVVLVERDGELHWVDATDNRQSGLLGKRGQPEYGAGLALGRDGDPLITRVAQVPEQPNSTVHDRFYLSSMGGPVDFVTTTTYRGSWANWFRGKLDRNGKRRLQKEYLDHYREVYGELRSSGPVRVEQDAENNAITVTESYRLEDFWSVDPRSRVAEFDVYATNVRNRLKKLKVDRDRSTPLVVGGPVRVVHRIQFHPNVASPERPLEEIAFAFDGFRYRHSEYAIGESFVFDSELEVSTDELDVDRVKGYEKFRERVMRNARSGRFYRQVDGDEIELGARTDELLSELDGLLP